MSGPSDDEAREFAAAFRSMLDWVHSASAADRNRNEVVSLIQQFLAGDGLTESVVSRALPVFEHVNLQTALNAWSAEPGRSVAVHGITIPPRHGTVRLQQLVTGDGIPPLRLSAPPLVDLPNGPGSTLACIVLAALLVTDDRGTYVVMVVGPSEHEPILVVDIAGLPVATAQAVHAELDELRSRLNVYRGHVLDVGIGPMGGVALSFGDVPTTSRDDVVLPEVVLQRVEGHALGVAEHREALLEAGQHLKRGLLLFGPPGAGKTHTTRYLVGRMSGYTRLLLTGQALHAIGSAAELARDLQPAVMVLEDVDLVAEDRSYGRGSSPVLFDLLDAMDGAAPDADCSSSSRPIDPTCSNRRWRRVPAGSTSRSRSTCPTPARAGGCSSSMPAPYPPSWRNPTSIRSSSAAPASPRRSSRSWSGGRCWNRCRSTRRCER